MDETPLQRSTKLRFPLIARQRWEALSKKAKADEDLLEILEVTHGRLNILEAYLEELSPPATLPSETSSVATPGLASRPSELFTGMHVVDGGSPLDVPGWLKQAIMDSFKSMPLHTGISFLAQTPCSLTLQLTWPLPTPSTETKAGILGDVGPELAVPIDAWPIDMHNEGIGRG